MMAASAQPKELFFEIPTVGTNDPGRPVNTARAGKPGPGQYGRPQLSPSSREELRRVVRVDVPRLAWVRTEVQAGRPAEVLLNLFEDLAFLAVVEAVQSTPRGYSLTGRLADIPFGTVGLVVNGDVVVGTVRTPRDTFSIRTVGIDTVIVQTVEPPIVEGEDVLEFDAGETTRSTPTSSTPDDDGGVIDVFVIWTREARVVLGGSVAHVRAQIDLAVAVTNAAYGASGAEQQIELVGAVEVDYEETGMSGTDLHRLLVNGDGHMDHVHLLRDRYAADLVHLLVARGNVTGKAFVLGPADGSAGFALTLTGAAGVPSLAFAHELGHNMGLRHDRWVYRGNWPFPYSHGYVNQAAFVDGASEDACWRTIMAYRDQCVAAGLEPWRLPRFSNPRQRYPDTNGDPLGIPGDAESDRVVGPADAVRSLDATRRVVANYRKSADRCSYRLPQGEITVGPSGGSFVFKVETTPSCSYDVYAHDGFLALDPPRLRSGTSEIRYRVEANYGFARIGIIAVGGEVLEIRQRARRAVKVCSRTPRIRDAIVALSGRQDCAAVTDFDLAAIYELNLSSAGISHLRPNDLDGLDLSALDLTRNSLSAVPDLTAQPNLARLSLATNKLTGAIPPHWGPKLTSLNLSDNELTDAIPTQLAELAGLSVLLLNGNNLTGSIPLNWGHGLRIVNLGNNQLTGMVPPELGKIPDLISVSLYQNRLSGSIPSAWAMTLNTLHLSDNRLTGDIPPELGELNSLGVLSLAGNALTGVIPPKWGDTLWSLDLSDNDLTGSIPAGLGALSRLAHLSLRGNELTGSIPTAIGNIAGLETLDLSENRLTGAIPLDLTGLARLTRLALAGNELTGCVPRALHGVPSNDFESLSLPTCSATVSIEAVGDGGEQVVTEGANVEFTVTVDPIPTSPLVVTVSIVGGAGYGVAPGDRTVIVAAGQVSRVLVIATEDDEVDDEDDAVTAIAIPSDRYTVSGSSASVNIHDDEGPSAPTIETVAAGDGTLTLTWTRPAAVGRDGIAAYDLRYRLDQSAQWTVVAPATDGDRHYTLAGLTNLAHYVLQVRAVGGMGAGSWSNRAIGIPRLCLDDISNLDCRTLLAAGETLAGNGRPLDWDPTRPVSEWESVQTNDSGRVVYVRPSSRGLAGSIPTILGRLAGLVRLDLDNNSLTGSIPPEFGNLTKLVVLRLYDNRLKGRIPPELGRLSRLQFLFLGDNDLRGRIPQELANLASLRSLDLSDTKLSGPIPPELGYLPDLHGLSLQNNYLVGHIPAELGRLSRLALLDLSGNSLTGPIPEGLTRLPLEHLYLSGNDLTGCVPRALLNVRWHDLGNLGLPRCGARVEGMTIVSRPSDGDAYHLGEDIRVAVRFDSQVIIVGLPVLRLTIGSNVRQAVFEFERDDELTFRYRVRVEDRDDDGVGIAADGLSAGNGAIRTKDGAAVDLDLGAHALANARDHRVSGVEHPETVPPKEMIAGADVVTLDLWHTLGVPCDLVECSVSLSDPSLVSASIHDGILTIVAVDGEEGDLTVTVLATGADGFTATVSFAVSVVRMRGITNRSWFLTTLRDADEATVVTEADPD